MKLNLSLIKLNKNCVPKVKSCYTTQYIGHIVESRTLKAQYIGMYIVLSLMAKCKKLTLCSDPSFAYLTCVHIRHIGSSNFEKFFLFVYSPYYLRVEHTNLLKPFQNKKGQKILRYPTKKQSFSLEKDCFFAGYPKIFLALLMYFEAALCMSQVL